MRVAFLTGAFPVLSETPVLNQITGLVERGHDVDVYADEPQRGVPFHPDVARLGLEARTRYPMWFRGTRRQRAAVAAEVLRGYRGAERRVLLRSLNPLRFWSRATSFEQFGRTVSFLPVRPYDICYCSFGQEAIKALRIRSAGALGGRLVTAFRGADVSKFVRKRGRHTYRRLFRRGDLFLPVCEEFARRIIRMGAPPERVRVHRTGIALGRYPFRPRCAPESGPVRFVSVGRLVEKKGIEYALRAVHRLAAEGCDVEYVIVGDGPLRARLESRIAELGLGGRVCVTGWRIQEEVGRLLDRAHVLLAPSHTAEDADAEGIPNVLKEGMALGLPVVSTRHAGIPELVADGVSGFLVPERDADALADRMRWLAAHPERWGELGAAGRATVERDYDIDLLNDRLVRLWDELLGTRRAR